ncbi:MAG: hypothetical protein ACREMA_19430, partial [Longimicrobiales bacterium]
LTMADALLRAWSIGNTASTRDIVSLERGATLAGNVIRHVDRGVILRGQKDGRIVFVPKEQVHRIDHRVPTSSEL